MSTVKLYAYKHKRKLNPEEFNTLLDYLSPDEQAKVQSFKFAVDQERSLLSRFILRQLLANELQLAPESIMFSYNEYKRPQLGDLDFNVSHAGDWLLIAIAPTGRVGVDVEKIREVESGLADTCFTEEEKTLIFTQGKFNLEKFFDFWTLKEAFIKADGRGLSYPLLDFYFCLGENPTINFKNKNLQDTWYFRTYELDSEYKLALCLDRQNFPSEILHIKNWQEFL